MKLYIKIFCFLLMAFFLLGAAACDSTAKVTDSEQTTHGADASATESDSAIETVAETTSDKETETELTQTVEEKEGEAWVMSSNGFNYTARGYSSVVGNTFTFNQGFEITFPENYFADSFKERCRTRAPIARPLVTRTVLRHT